MGKRFKMLLSPSPNLQLVHYRNFYVAPLRQVVFLFTDLQIKDEAFLEDISMILTTGATLSIYHHDQRENNDDQHLHDVAAGEVPNLFPADEKAEILERVQNTAREEGR